MASQQTLHPDRKDELLTVLADARRRAILDYFSGSPDDAATVETLTDELQGRDHLDGDPTAVGLVHSDLPKMDAAGVVDFDHRTRIVRYRADSRVERLLTVIADL